MKAKSRYQPSKIVEALFKTAVVKIKADADKAIAKQDATSETEVVSAKAGLEAKAEAAEQKTEDVGTAFEDVAEKKVEITAESQEPVAGEVYKAIQQMTHPQPNQLRDDLLVASALCAKDIMEKNIIWARPDDSVHQVLAKMQQADASYTMIGSDGVLEGIVSKSDLAGAVSIYLRPIFAKWRRPLDDATLQIRIKWIMTRPVYIIRPQTPLAVIVRNMSRFRVCALPVVTQQAKVLGLVTEADILDVLLNLKSSPNTSASGNEHQEQPTSDHFSDHREIESTPTMEPDLLAVV